MAAAPLAMLALGATALLSVAAARHPGGVSAGAATPPAAVLPAVSATSASGHPQTGPEAWQRLLVIESGLVAQQDELAAQEREIARITKVLSLPVPDDQLPVALGRYVALTGRLADLVTAHQATQAAYERSLQAEYDLYRQAAQSPPQSQQLLAAAPAPGVRDAVAHDLVMVRTQLDQETAIAAAEQRLAQFTGLVAAQLDALRRHVPFLAPEVAPITQRFGPTDVAMEPPLTYHGTFYPHFHTGVDLAGPLDAPIHAAADGVVLLASTSVDPQGHPVGYGTYVVIGHPDGFVTLYAHLDGVTVHPGDLVHQGQVIGLEGSTGWSTGPHLHFEIRHLGDLLDPAPFLASQLP